MTHMGGEWGWQGDRGQAMAGGYAVAQPGGRGITSQSPSVCPAGPGEEKEHKEEPCGRADGLRVIKAIKSVSGVRRGGGFFAAANERGVARPGPLQRAPARLRGGCGVKWGHGREGDSDEGGPWVCR